MLFLPVLATLPWKWIGLGAGALLLVVAAVTGIKLYGGAQFDAGRDGERAIWEQMVADQALAQTKLERKADGNLAAGRAEDAAVRDANREEIENATAHIPDQVPSDRQRLRVCLELRRRGEDNPACGDLPAR